MASRPHIGFVLERSLGHMAHADTLMRLLPDQGSITADISPIDFGIDGAARRIPAYGNNWTVRAGVRARRAIRRMHRTRPLDALFIHTQVPAVLVPDWVGKVPTVISLDATPLQYDAFGAEYRHETGSRRVEELKWRFNRACLARAGHVVTWTQWAMDGVVDGYGIEPDKVSVIPPAVHLPLWRRSSRRRADDGVVRILFVGGDLERKGGDVLLEAFEALRSDGESVGGPALRLDLVTRADVADRPGVHVHRTMTPNEPELVALYHQADIFALPTRADFLSIALIEAAAAELPLIGTAVAGVPEIVVDGQTGLVVPPGDRGALINALRTLVDQPMLRRRLGVGASELVATRFDATKNVSLLAELLVGMARGSDRTAH
jgi:glycosyltransferase involved in cell wall biosynthesis